MVINGRTVFVYDIESFHNLFICNVINSESKKTKTIEISDRRNDISEILSIFLNDRVVLCGYNCSFYDDIIINYILANYESLSNQASFSSAAIIKGVSDSIMKELKEPGNPWLKYKHMEVFFSVDLMRMLFSEKNRVSLKECQVTMDYPNVVEYDKGFSVYVQEYEIDEVIKYCFNDAFSTLELLNRSESSIRLRESMIEHIG